MKKEIQRFRTLLVMAVVICIVLSVHPSVYSQTQISPTPTTNFWNSLDTYIKVVAGVVAAITAILGVPVAFLQIRKTIAEIRKTELEAKKLQEQTGGELPAKHEGHRIYLSDSDHNVIQILADPRFAAPLLILLDFVIVYIVLALAGYAVGVFSLGRIGQIIRTVIAAILLLPLFIEALRLRGVLRSAWDKDSESKTDK